LKKGKDVLKPKEIRADLVRLFETLEETHPALFFRCPRGEYHRKKRALLGRFKRGVSVGGFSREIASFLHLLHDGHTGVAGSTRGTNLRLPFETRLVGGRLFVAGKMGKAAGLSHGDEISTIGGCPVKEYLEDLTKYRSYEVHENALCRLGAAFPFKSAHLDPARTILLGVRKRDGTPVQRRMRWERVPGGGQESLYRPFEFRLLRGCKAGYLHWRSFFDRRVYDLYSKNGIIPPGQVERNRVPDFELFLNRVFAQCSRSRVKSLIVDVRENSGGNSYLGNNLLAFLTRKRVKDYTGWIRLSPLLKRTYGREFGQLFDRYRLGTKIPAEEANKVFSGSPEAKGLELRRHPKSLFRGKLILLTSYLTYSAAETFAALVKDNGLGVLVGEPTGNGSNGPIDALSFRLPNSGIRISVSFALQLRPDPRKRKSRMLKPDLRVSQTVQDFLDGRDSILESAKRLVS